MNKVKNQFLGLHYEKGEHKKNTESNLLEQAQRLEVRPSSKLTLVWSHLGCWTVIHIYTLTQGQD